MGIWLCVYFLLLDTFLAWAFSFFRDGLLLAKNTRRDGRWNIRLLDWLFGYLGFVDLLFVATKSGDFVELVICL